MLATAAAKIASPKLRKSSTLDTGSVSQAKATNLPLEPSADKFTKTIPSAVVLPERAADTF
ncbi:hypothetical protein D3C78_1975640 [compost metagenome]